MTTCGVIGLGNLGKAAALYLTEHHVEVIALDRDEARVEAIKDRLHRAVIAEATEERALRAAGIAECSTVVLALGEQQLEQAVLATMLLRELGVGRIISRASTDVQRKVLERVGVSRVIFPERQMGEQVAREIILPAVDRWVPLGDELLFAEVGVPEALVGRTLGEAQVRQAHGVSVVGVRHRRTLVFDDGTSRVEWEMNKSPGPDTALTKDDKLLIVGPDAGLRSLVPR